MTASEVIFGESSELHEVPQEANFEGAMLVYGDGKAHDATWLPIDVMTPVEAKKNPSVELNRLGEIAAGDLLHIAMSIIRSCTPVLAGVTSTVRHPSTAS